MSDESAADFISKRLERFAALEKNCVAVASDMKELKYQLQQWEAKVETFACQILAKKAEIAELDEQIARRKVEAAGSFNNFRDDLSRREAELTKAIAELRVQQEQVKSRSSTAEYLINKAEKAIGKIRPEVIVPSLAGVGSEAPAEAKRGPGRPKSESADKA